MTNILAILIIGNNILIKEEIDGSSPWAANVSGCSKRTRDVEKENFFIMMVFTTANHV